MQPAEDRFITALNDLTAALRHGFITLCQRVERLEQSGGRNAEILASLSQDMAQLLAGVAALQREAPPARPDSSQAPSLRVIEGGGGA